MTRILAVALLIFLLGASGSRAGEGFCRGDMERARIVFEALNFRLDSLLESGFQATHRGAGMAFEWAARLTVWRRHLLALQTLEVGLEDPARSPGQLVESLRFGWSTSEKILASLDRAPAGMPAGLQKAVTDAVASFAVCRSVALGHAEPCGRLAQDAPRRYHECRELFVNFGILFSHRCEPESVTLAAWLSGMQYQDAFDWCDILARGAGEKCRLGADQSPHELAGCRAMATLDESYCRAEGLSPEYTRDCLGKLRTYRYVRGQLSQDDWRPWMYDPVFEAAVRAARALRTGSPDCLSCARQAYLRTARRYFWFSEPGQ